MNKTIGPGKLMGIMEDTRPGDSVKLGNYRLPLPRSRILRIVIGVLLVVFGVFGFLPVLGFWMIPLGLLILSIDIPRVRRWRRRFAVWFSRTYPATATRLGIRSNGNGNGNGNGGGAGGARPPAG